MKLRKNVYITCIALFADDTVLIVNIVTELDSQFAEFNWKRCP